MEVTHHRDWSEQLRSGFAGAGANARAYQSADGESMAVAEPAEEFEGELIAVEYYPPGSDGTGIHFLAPDWDTVQELLERLFGEY